MKKRLDTSIPEVPASLDQELADFLESVKVQIETREGARLRSGKERRFATVSDVQSRIDDEISRLDRQIKGIRPSLGKMDEVDLSPLRAEIAQLRGDVEGILNSQILNIQLKEGVFVNTFIHVGPDVPSDEGWDPEGVGITSVGIYGVGPETEDGQFGHFFVGSQDLSGDFGKLAPFIGDEIFAGELRVGDDIAYTSGESVLAGDDYLWYRPGAGLQIQMLTGALTVGDHTTGTGTLQGQDGFFVIDEGVTVHGFSIIDGYDTGDGGTLDRNDAVIGKYFSGNGIFWDDSASALNIAIDGDVGDGIIIDSDGLTGYSGSEPVFGFLLNPYTNTAGTTFDAGSFFAVGDAYIGDVNAGNGLHFNSTDSILNVFVGHSNRGISIDENGLWGWDENDEIKFGFSFAEIYGVPAGSAYFSGQIFASEIIGDADNGLTVKPDALSDRRIELDSRGLLAYDSTNTLIFGFTLSDFGGDFPPGSVWMKGNAYFEGDITASNITESFAMWGVEGGRRIELDDTYGLLGYTSANELVFGITLDATGGLPAGTAAFTGDVYIGNYSGGKGIHYDSVNGTIDYKGVTLTMVEESASIVEEGDSLTRLADLVLDNLDDGTKYGRIKKSALTADGFAVVDELVDGTYARTKASALTADGLIVYDEVVDGTTYAKVKKSALTADGFVAYSGIVGTGDVVEEGDSLARLVDRTLDNIDDTGNWKKVKASAVDSTGAIFLDTVNDGGTYGLVKGSALTSDGLIVYDEVVDGTYGKVKSTYISAGKITLAQEIDGQGSLATQDDADWDSQVTGPRKPDDYATVGATWGSNLFSIPDRITDNATTGLNLTASYMGYYNGSVWTSFIRGSDGSGQFAGGNIQWDEYGSASFNGSLTVGNPAGVRSDINVADGADVTNQRSEIYADNPNFAAGDTGWDATSMYGAVNIVNDSSRARSGNYVLKIDGDGANKYLHNSHYFPVNEGDRVIIQCFVDSSDATGGTAKVRVRFQDETGGNVGTPGGNEISYGNSGYEASRAVVTAPSGAVRCHLSLYVDYPTGTWYIDDCTVTVVAKDADISLGNLGERELSSTTNRYASRISETTSLKWAGESGADITNDHTAYNVDGAGTLDSGATLTMKGDLDVVDGSILFYNGTTYRGGLWSSSSGVALVNNDVSCGLWLRYGSIGEVVVGGSYFNPNTSGGMSLGASNYKWSHIYGNHINVDTKSVYLGTSTNYFILRFRDPGTSTWYKQEAYIAYS